MQLGHMSSLDKFSESNKNQSNQTKNSKANLPKILTSETSWLSPTFWP
jgi:hypothetical protein